MPRRSGADTANTKPSGRYHHGDLRAALVDAALAIVDEEGLAAISTRALARRLGVSHAAPARHFPSRNALLAAIAAEAFDRFARALADAGHHAPTPQATLPAMGRAYVRFGLDHPHLLQVMFSPELAELEPPDARLGAASERAYAILMDGVKMALGPDADESNVAAGSFLAWSTVHGAVTLWLDGPIRGMLPKRGAKAQFLALADQAIEATGHAILGMAQGASAHARRRK